MIEYDFTDFRVISGAQNGVDQAALEAAMQLGIKTGGYCPKDCRTLDDNRPDLITKYGLKETEQQNYQKRTELNVASSDGTLRIATNLFSAGEKLTLKCIKKYDKPHFDIDLNHEHNFQNVVEWIKINGILKLNVAGNSERTSPGIYDITFPILTSIFKGVID